MKEIEVTISETLSSTQSIEVPDDFDESNYELLEKVVKQQIVLPSKLLYTNKYDWDVDDFCVIV